MYGKMKKLIIINIVLKYNEDILLINVFINLLNLNLIYGKIPMSGMAFEFVIVQ